MGAPGGRRSSGWVDRQPRATYSRSLWQEEVAPYRVEMANDTPNNSQETVERPVDYTPPAVVNDPILQMLAALAAGHAYSSIGGVGDVPMATLPVAGFKPSDLEFSNHYGTPMRAEALRGVLSDNDPISESIVGMLDSHPELQEMVAEFADTGAGSSVSQMIMGTEVGQMALGGDLLGGIQGMLADADAYSRSGGVGSVEEREAQMARALEDTSKAVQALTRALHTNAETGETTLVPHVDVTQGYKTDELFDVMGLAARRGEVTAQTHNADETAAHTVAVARAANVSKDVFGDQGSLQGQLAAVEQYTGQSATMDPAQVEQQMLHITALAKSLGVSTDLMVNTKLEVEKMLTDADGGAVRVMHDSTGRARVSAVSGLPQAQAQKIAEETAMVLGYRKETGGDTGKGAVHDIKSDLTAAQISRNRSSQGRQLQQLAMLTVSNPEVFANPEMKAEVERTMEAAATGDRRAFYESYKNISSALTGSETGLQESTETDAAWAHWKDVNAEAAKSYSNGDETVVKAAITWADNVGSRALSREVEDRAQKMGTKAMARRNRNLENLTGVRVKEDSESKQAAFTAMLEHVDQLAEEGPDGERVISEEEAEEAKTFITSLKDNEEISQSEALSRVARSSTLTGIGGLSGEGLAVVGERAGTQDRLKRSIGVARDLGGADHVLDLIDREIDTADMSEADREAFKEHKKAARKAVAAVDPADKESIEAAKAAVGEVTQFSSLDAAQVRQVEAIEERAARATNALALKPASETVATTEENRRVFGSARVQSGTAYQSEVVGQAKNSPELLENMEKIKLQSYKDTQTVSKRRGFSERMTTMVLSQEFDNPLMWMYVLNADMEKLSAGDGEEFDTQFDALVEKAPETFKVDKKAIKKAKKALEKASKEGPQGFDEVVAEHGEGYRRALSQHGGVSVAEPRAAAEAPDEEEDLFLGRMPYPNWLRTGFSPPGDRAAAEAPAEGVEAEPRAAAGDSATGMPLIPVAESRPTTPETPVAGVAGTPNDGVAEVSGTPPGALVAEVAGTSPETLVAGVAGTPNDGVAEVSGSVEESTSASSYSGSVMVGGGSIPPAFEAAALAPEALSATVNSATLSVSELTLEVGAFTLIGNVGGSDKDHTAGMEVTLTLSDGEERASDPSARAGGRGVTGTDSKFSEHVFTAEAVSVREQERTQESTTEIRTTETAAQYGAAHPERGPAGSRSISAQDIGLVALPVSQALPGGATRVGASEEGGTAEAPEKPAAAAGDLARVEQARETQPHHADGGYNDLDAQVARIVEERGVLDPSVSEEGPPQETVSAKVVRNLTKPPVVEVVDPQLEVPRPPDPITILTDSTALGLADDFSSADLEHRAPVATPLEEVDPLGDSVVAGSGPPRSASRKTDPLHQGDDDRVVQVRIVGSDLPRNTTIGVPA